MFPVFLQALTEDQYIVEVYCDKLIQFICEDLVHQPLERGWRIAQPKRHYDELKVASVSTKSCLLY